jgi:hypothetical protein
MLLDFPLSLSLSHYSIISLFGSRVWSKYFSNTPLLEAIIKETLEDILGRSTSILDLTNI